MIEQEIVAKLHELAYAQHISIAAGLEEDAFEKEIESAHERYHQVAGAVAPWLQLKPQKTAAELWADLQERRKDPAHMAWVKQEQQLLDDRAAKYKAAVAAELQLMQDAREFEKKRRAELKKPLGRRYVRLPTGKGRRR
ncbi:MAG TPA: hypothetical protein VLT59_04300 [Steroidobacteraceae bacterium]|nr:hypothetical protein [Steroidobacteraceae bacterium]